MSVKNAGSKETLARTIQPNTYNYRLFILLSFFFLNNRTHLESIYQGHYQGPCGGYTMIMFSLHIPSIKINKQLILHMTLDSRQRPWKRPWKRPCQQLYKQKHTTIDCSFFLGLLFRYLESIYQGLRGGLYNDYV